MNSVLNIVAGATGIRLLHQKQTICIGLTDPQQFEDGGNIRPHINLYWILDPLLKNIVD